MNQEHRETEAGCCCSPSSRWASASTLAISTRFLSLGSAATCWPSSEYWGTSDLQCPHPVKANAVGEIQHITTIKQAGHSSSVPLGGSGHRVHSAPMAAAYKGHRTAQGEGKGREMSLRATLESVLGGKKRRRTSIRAALLPLCSVAKFVGAASKAGTAMSSPSPDLRPNSRVSSCCITH